MTPDQLKRAWEFAEWMAGLTTPFDERARERFRETHPAETGLAKTLCEEAGGDASETVILETLSLEEALAWAMVFWQFINVARSIVGNVPLVAKDTFVDLPASLGRVN